MLFSSITFLYIFLPVTLLVYYLVPKKARNFVLLIASLVFYFFGEPVYTVLLVISSLSDFFHSLYIEKHRGTKKAKVALVSSIAVNLGMLGFFKYTDFFIGIVNGVTGASIPLLNLPLPVGISFFTFQTMSYTIDVYRGRVRAQRNLITMATFVCLFPQLVAGPIVRYIDVERELSSRSIDTDMLASGTRRLLLGLGKKILLADAFGQLCMLYRDAAQPSVVFAWIYAISFMLQIYFDFSGYSDMAIGLGRLLGFKFPENFDHPYASRSATEFWRRWHMTMGGWFRDYVYIPLGGNRVSKWKWVRNVLVVWLVTGFWHGADWTFMLWGVMFGVLLLIEKLWLGKYLEKGKIWPHLYLLFTVCVSFVIFNSGNVGNMANDLAALFGLGGLPFFTVETGHYLRSYAVLLALGCLCASPLLMKLYRKVQHRPVTRWVEIAAAVVMLVLVTASLIGSTFHPFLYYNF